MFNFLRDWSLSLCFLSFSVTTEEPETRQHRHAAWHHPHWALPHSGVWVSGEYMCSLNYTHRMWLFLTVSTVSHVLQDSDLKQYLDNCGNLMSMYNVKVSHRHDSALSGVKHYWLYTRERERKPLYQRKDITLALIIVFIIVFTHHQCLHLSVLNRERIEKTRFCLARRHSNNLLVSVASHVLPLELISANKIWLWQDLKLCLLSFKKNHNA